MSINDTQGKGRFLDEGRVERHTSRPNENGRGSYDGKKSSPVDNLKNKTSQRVYDTLNNKK